MTHDRQESEPNLVPLLDLVLQLVMFFMMCANFVVKQTDQTIMLPVAESAKPADETPGDVVFLNIDASGRLLVFGQPLAEGQIPAFLRAAYDEAMRKAASRNIDQPDTLVIIRADRDADYAAVYHLMRLCREAGLRRLQLRATRVN